MSRSRHPDPLPRPAGGEGFRPSWRLWASGASVVARELSPTGGKRSLAPEPVVSGPRSAKPLLGTPGPQSRPVAYVIPPPRSENPR